MERLSWWEWTLFGLASLAALAIGWWSMYTLGITEFHMPWYLAAGISAAFDIGAIFLASLSIRYAKSDEAGASVELATFVFIALSAWINWQHAELLNLPLVGMIFFSCAPVLAGILLRAILTYLNKKQKSENFRTVRALPNAGVLTWVLKPVKSFKLLKTALSHRLRTAEVAHILNEKLTSQDVQDAKSLENSFANYYEKPVIAFAEVRTENSLPLALENDVRSENSQVEKTSRRIENSEKSLSSQVDEIFANPKVENSQVGNLPHFLSPGMSVNKVASVCFENGISDLDVVFQYAKMVNENVEKTLVSKSLSRARNKK